MPDQDAVPRAVRELIRDTIHTLEQLELLLRLHAQPSGGLTLEQLTTELGFTPALTESALSHLTECGLLRRHERPVASWSYAPSNEAQREAVSELSRSYLRDRVDLMRLIADDAVGRVRKGVREMFQESLRMRSRKDA